MTERVVEMRACTGEPAKPSIRDKVKPIAELAELTRKLQARGKVVAMAHGTFDLLHMGHVRHLEKAREQGDHLIVTITDDRYVNKGPGRPVFTGRLRAEMLAALEHVDWVGINEAPSAEDLIRTIRPDVYVKGSDYSNANEDVTGKISEERRAIESYGGRVFFTEDITFSSSALLNRHFELYSPALREYLDRQVARQALPQLISLLDRIVDSRVLFVGDYIIDEYQYVSPLGKSPKENLISTLYRDRELFAGGVVAAANHAAGFCKKVDIITCVGRNPQDEVLLRTSVKPNVGLKLFQRPDKPTVRKCRFIDDFMRKLFEVYEMDDQPLAGPLESDFAQTIARAAADYDLVVVTDFGHGLITRKIIDALCSHARFLAVNAQSNSANTGFNLVTKYPRADYVCIDAPEARLAVADKHVDIGVIASKMLPERVSCDRLILTHGRHGCVTYDRNTGLSRIPAFTKAVVDTVGAGDAFLAVTSPLAATGADMEHVGFIGNAVGALKVGIVGHRQSVGKVPLVKYLQTLLK